MQIVGSEKALRETNEALNRHAIDLLPVGTALFMYLMELQGKMWSRRGGANSWVVQLFPSGEMYYLKGHKWGVIEIRRSERGPVIKTLSTRMEVRLWVNSLKPVVPKKVKKAA